MSKLTILKLLLTSMVTLAFAQMVYYFAQSLRNWGGDDGFTMPRRNDLGFASLADHFARRLDAQVILTGNSDEEAIVHSITERMATKPINLVGRTSLGGLAALISALDLFVSNDTGPAHIACAVDTLSITIFGPADYRRWTPLDQKRHPVIRRPVECSPCSYWDCPIDHRCLRWISPEMVIAVAENLLAKGTVSCGV